MMRIDLASVVLFSVLVAGTSAEPPARAASVTQAAPGLPSKLNLEPGKSRSWPDSPEWRIAPGFELRCRFRLNELREGVQNLIAKDGEYILRVNGTLEGGALAFFVQTEGKWEPRLLGPVIQAGAWYEVLAAWPGTEMILEVNGTVYHSRRQGSVHAGDKPLIAGPVAGALEELSIQNPACERGVALAARAKQTEGAADRREFGGQAGWAGWTGEGGLVAKVQADRVTAPFGVGRAMLVSPPLATDIASRPFVCLDVDAPGPGWTGYLDFVTDSGQGSIPFVPQSQGRTTLITATACDAWIGQLQRLAVSFQGGKGGVTMTRLGLSSQAVGVPWFYIQDFAPGRAKLRPGREETVIAGIKNLGGEAENIAVKLEAPGSIQILGPTERTIPYLGKDDFELVSWKIRASQAGGGKVRVKVSGRGAETHERELALDFEPLPDLPRTVYVPQPVPAKTDYVGLMHYCALWKEGTHQGWKRIEPWPGRRPAIGWYDEGTPEVADWHIKYALEHGISGFIYCWYRAHLEPKIEHRLGHAIHDGLLQAKYRDRFKFTIMWENGCAEGVKDAADLLDNVLPYWIENYFKQPNYLKVDNMPVLFVWQPRRLIPQLGGAEGAKQTLELARARCRAAGLAGLRWVACMDGPNEQLGRDIEASGWDAVTGYIVDTHKIPLAGTDPDGIPFRDYGQATRSYRDTWLARDACTGSVPDIPNVVMGWDPRPWHRGGEYGYLEGARAADFEAACRDAKALVDAKPAGRWDRNLVVFDNWTEFGEGHYIEPTSGLGFSYVNAIKRVFCREWAAEALTDVIPEDLGLVPPQARYEAVRAGFGPRLPWQPLRIQGDLLGCWRFDSELGGSFPDSSPNQIPLKAEKVWLEEGRKGQALRCGDGAAVNPVPGAFFNPGGVTVALWCKPSEAQQSDHWMVNTVSDGRSGYRLGLSGGKPYWQVPLESWSHGLTGPDALPVNEWSHVAATVDQRLMRLFVNGREVAALERWGLVKPGRELVVGGYGADLERARFRGWLDDVQLYRRPLAASEIAELAKADREMRK